MILNFAWPQLCIHHQRKPDVIGRSALHTIKWLYFPQSHHTKAGGRWLQLTNPSFTLLPSPPAQVSPSTLAPPSSHPSSASTHSGQPAQPPALAPLATMPSTLQLLAYIAAQFPNLQACTTASYFKMQARGTWPTDRAHPTLTHHPRADTWIDPRADCE